MKLTILGNRSPFPGPKQACSGYLVSCNDQKILLDCGTGIFSNLQKYASVVTLDAVLISHLHPDHCSDLFALGFASAFACRDGQRNKPLPVYLPPDSLEAFAQIVHNMGNLTHIYNQGLELREYGHKEQIGTTLCDFIKGQHKMNSHLVRLTAEGKTFVYTGDTGYFPGLVPWIKGCALLLSECTWDEPQPGSMHMSAQEAGLLAAEAQAGKLLLTHFTPDANLDSKLAQAEKTYKGPLAIAMMDTTYRI